MAAASSALAAAHRPLFLPRSRGNLNLAEGSEHNVGEGPVHRLAHDHGEDETGGTIQGAGNHQDLVVKHKAQESGRKAGVRIKQGDDGGHIGAANRRHQKHAKNQCDSHHEREKFRVLGVEDQPQRDEHGGAEHREADEILPLVSDGTLGQDFLELPRRDQASGEGQGPDDDLERNLDHLKLAEVGDAHVVFGDADQGRRQRSKGVAEGSPLGHRGHVNQAQGYAHDGAHHQRHHDPFVVDDLVIAERGQHRQRRPDFARQDPMPRGSRRTQPAQRQDEQGHSDNVGNVNELLRSHRVHGFLVRLSLNIRSMRSVMRKPPTMLLNEAATATAPRTVERVLWCRPVMMMAATTTIASSALVRDISGV